MFPVFCISGKIENVRNISNLRFIDSKVSVRKYINVKSLQ